MTGSALERGRNCLETRAGNYSQIVQARAGGGVMNVLSDPETILSEYGVRLDS